jgi:hypothetical protein
MHLSGIERAAQMRALIRLLAARGGQLLVASSVGNQAGVSQATALRHIGLLEEVFLIKRVPAWSRNISSRAGRASKIAFVDSGIAANLLGADARSLIRPGGPFGPLLEGFVVMELARQATWSQTRVELFHYRTKDDVEIDAVLESCQGKVVGIEVKAATPATWPGSATRQATRSLPVRPASSRRQPRARPQRWSIVVAGTTTMDHRCGSRAGAGQHGRAGWGGRGSRGPRTGTAGGDRGRGPRAGTAGGQSSPGATRCPGYPGQR